MLSRARPRDLFRNLLQELRGLVPADAAVGDRDAVREGFALGPRLFAGIQVALDHHAEDGALTGLKGAGDLVKDGCLLRVIFSGVVVRAVDHDAPPDFVARRELGGGGDVAGMIVALASSAAQDDMTIEIAF